jgi:hypothetical protein
VCNSNNVLLLLTGLCLGVVVAQDYEFLQTKLTLQNVRGQNTKFFAFADTLTTKAFKRDNECHGWLGVRYQSAPA